MESHHSQRDTRRSEYSFLPTKWVSSTKPLKRPRPKVTDCSQIKTLTHYPFSHLQHGICCGIQHFAAVTNRPERKWNGPITSPTLARRRSLRWLSRVTISTYRQLRFCRSRPALGTVPRPVRESSVSSTGDARLRDFWTSAGRPPIIPLQSGPDPGATPDLVR